MKKLLAAVVLLSFLLQGCYRYYIVPKEQLTKIDSAAYLKIAKNDSTVILTNKDKIIFNRADDKQITLTKDSTEEKVMLSDIKEVREQRFDYVMTIFSSVGGAFVVFLLFGIWVVSQIRIG